MEIKGLCQILSKAFDMTRATAKVSPKSLKEDDQNLVRKAKKINSKAALMEAILAVR